MKNDFMAAILQITSEKGLAKETIIEAIESALTSTYKRTFGSVPEVHVRLNEQTGDFKVFADKTVVDSVDDEHIELSLRDAKLVTPDPAVGDTLEVEIEDAPRDFGRIAAQTAMQVIKQRIGDAERDQLFDSISQHQDDVVTGVVQRLDPKGVILTLQEVGDVEAVLPLSEQSVGEHYRIGQRLKVYVAETHKTVRGLQITVSRANRNLVKRLFELEMPEVRSGAVEIKALARDAGVRTKVAVFAKQPNVDPVGACVGQRGVRIQNVINELNGEKIDAVPWNEDPKLFIAEALRPAKVVRVEIRPNEKRATAIVADRELSLAIGKEGQNARLAARLTGWHIDIKKASDIATAGAVQEEVAVGRE